MEPTSSILLVVAAGSVLTSLVVVLKKGIKRCSCCGFTCTQDVGVSNDPESGRQLEEIQTNMSKMIESLKKQLTPRRRSMDAGAAAVQASNNLQATIMESSDNRDIRRLSKTLNKDDMNLNLDSLNKNRRHSK